ncbi:MAG: hypothetical protein NTV60_01235 [Candidatus Kaiserbacteria bacterium]|nr:hypothetical protein [Candidatus Kaiserbacteria bacterium]
MRILFPHKLRATWKVCRRKVSPHTEKIGFGLLVVLMVVWFYSPLPTVAARYVWEHYRAGSFALLLDRSDAGLALAIGDYYFGNDPTTSSREHPYDPSLAKKAAEKAIRINPSVEYAHYMRARVDFVQANFDESLTELNKEFSLFPDRKRTLYMRGLVYAYRGKERDLSLAEKDFQAFITWAPTEWAGYNDLAFVFAKEKKYDFAVTVLKEGIIKANGGATNPWLWNALGVMELNLNKPAPALASLIKAQRFATALTDVQWQRAYPGNNPLSAQAGLEAMQVGIARNVIKAYAALEK